MATNRRSISLLAASTVVLGLGLSACGDGGETANPDDELISRTVVTVNEDGTETVRQYLITKERQARDIERKRLFAEGKHTAAVLEDDSCPTQAMWMYDAEGLSGNQICFIMTPKSTSWQSVKLWNYPNPSGGSWDQRVRSFYAGEDMSLFADSLHCKRIYDPHTRQDTADLCVQSGRVLALRAP